MTEDRELVAMAKAALERNEPRVKANIDPETGEITFEEGSIKGVLIQIDKESAMYSITVGGKVVDGGNFWDFSFPDSLEDILEAAGVTVDVEEYTYEN